MKRTDIIKSVSDNKGRKEHEKNTVSSQEGLRSTSRRTKQNKDYYRCRVNKEKDSRRKEQRELRVVLGRVCSARASFTNPYHIRKNMLNITEKITSVSEIKGRKTEREKCKKEGFKFLRARTPSSFR